MAALRSSLPLVIGAVLLFGLLTFLFGLVVGANLMGVPDAPPATKPSLALPSVTVPSASVLPTTPSLSAPPVSVPAPPPPAPAATPAPAPVAPAAVPPAAAPVAPPSSNAPGSSAPSSSGAAEPAIKLVKVKGFGFGEPPSAPPNSELRGPLLEQAANAPPAAPALAPADSGQAVAAVPPPPVSAAVKDPIPPMVYSVAVGRFLVESRAGALSSAVAAKGFTPVVVVTDPPDATGWMTVTLGPQEDATHAKRLAKEAEAQGFDTWMVSWLPP
jgi:hypothetical protein